jgi:hypothetical protein
MVRGRRLFVRMMVLAALTGLTAVRAPQLGAAGETLPARLSDKAYWQLVTDLSEPGGSFRSDNFLSNENAFQTVIPDLKATLPPGGVYLGVGPEQNFTYVVGLRPRLAFIVDIRRGNLDLHLLYKALFELAETRADFVGLLFSRPQPPGLSARSTTKEIFDAYDPVSPSERLYTENMARIRDRLFTGHHFELAEEDLRGIEYVYRAFFMFGPGIRYSPQGLTASTVQPTYATLMAATDQAGQPLGFLGGEDRFTFVKSLQSRNLIVPVVGDFAGPKAIKGVGAYLSGKGATVAAFYLSNVEEYLRRDNLWNAFCANVTALPRDATSTYIRSVRATLVDGVDGLRSEIGPLSEISNCR